MNTGPDGAWEYLGDAESGTAIRLVPSYGPVPHDPSDIALVDVAAAISGVFSRWNERVLDRLKAFRNSPDSIPGTYDFNVPLRYTRGNFELCLVPAYATKASYVAANGHPAWHFPSVRVLPTRRVLSTAVSRELLRLVAGCVPNRSGQAVLYSHVSPADLPLVD